MVDDWYGDKMKVLGTKITDPGWKQWVLPQFVFVDVAHLFSLSRLLEDMVNFDERGFIGSCPNSPAEAVQAISQSSVLSNFPQRNESSRNTGVLGSSVLALCNNM
jgi:hypothetical protein